MTSGKIILSGASSGIGYATATRLLDEQRAVIGLARRVDQCPAHALMQAHAIDFSKLDNLDEELKSLARQHPEPEAVICCTGYGAFGGLEEFSSEQIRRMIDVNFTSQAMLVRAFLPALKRRGQGRIIIIGSEAALAGGRQGAIYSASKFALRGFAQSLREECARNAIGVSLVNPGMVKTSFFDELNFQPGEHQNNYILAADIADTVSWILNMRASTVVDEVNLSPMKKVIDFKKDR